MTDFSQTLPYLENTRNGVIAVRAHGSHYCTQAIGLLKNMTRPAVNFLN